MCFLTFAKLPSRCYTKQTFTILNYFTVPSLAADEAKWLQYRPTFSSSSLPLLPLLLFSALILPAFIFFLYSLDHSCHALCHYYMSLVPSYIVDWFLFFSCPTLQSALPASTGTAAASRVHSASTAPGPAITSRAIANACPASLALYATKASSCLCPFDLSLLFH